MIVGIGTDIIEIKRFEKWASKPQKYLQRIFSSEEIAYALSIPSKSAERFAVRFAAREAFYKAANKLIGQMPFLEFCRGVSILGNPPQLIYRPLQDYQIHLSLSHSRNHAIALVIVEKL